MPASRGGVGCWSDTSLALTFDCALARRSPLVATLLRLLPLRSGAGFTVRCARRWALDGWVLVAGLSWSDDESLELASSL